MAALLLAAVSAACSIQAEPTPIIFDERLPFSPGPDIGGQALQEEVFADGEVTADEYERAMDAAIGRADGFQVEGPLRYPEGYLVVETGMDPTLRLTLRASVSEEESDRYGEVNGRAAKLSGRTPSSRCTSGSSVPRKRKFKHGSRGHGLLGGAGRTHLVSAD